MADHTSPPPSTSTEPPIATLVDIALLRRSAEPSRRRAAADGDVVPPTGELVAGSPGFPLLRGVMHMWAAQLAVSLAVVLVVLTHSTRPRVAAIVYGLGLTTCLSVSAAYHRGRWSNEVKTLLCRIDHSTIFLLIAGTATPIALLTLHGAIGGSLLLTEWIGAGCGIAIALFWRQPPVWAEVAPYLVLGWLGLLTIPALIAHTGAAGLLLLVGGGVLYSVGAMFYAFERPNPWPRIFGFHEVFHTFVTAAAGTHAVLIAAIVLSA